MSDPSGLAYPVLCLARDNSICAVRSADDLRTCNAVAYWGNRYFHDLQILDAVGAPYTVVRSETERRFTPLRRAVARLLNQTLRVTLELRSEGPPSLSSAKARVAAWLERAPEFWEESDDLENWKRRIAECRDMRQLVDLFE